MAVASNPLLQISPASRSQAVSVASLAKAPASSNDRASSFADVYAKHGNDVPAKADAPKKSAAEQKVASAETPGASDKKTTSAAQGVAADGKKLPVASSSKAAASEKTDKSASSDKTESADEASLEDAAAVSTADDGMASAPPALLDATVPAVALDTAAVQPALATMVAAPAIPPAQVADAAPAVDEAADESFDPARDVLADLPAVRLALEHNAKANGTTSAHASKTSETGVQADADPVVDSSFANGLAAMVEKEKAGGSTDGGDQAFAGLIDDGLKDIKSAAGDTRMDDFANRLQSLTQAVTPKTASALPVTNPLGQPLAMQQSGWSEGLVNRVMYLSSQNLKSADIQLTPAELGRLDIRVDISPDQQTQVTFTSAHIGVREALESQQHRLKDMFAQQGMGQLDVNVSDQSRQSQSEQQAQQSRQLAASSRRGEGGSDEIEPVAAAAAQAVTGTTVLGTSAVDYYA